MTETTAQNLDRTQTLTRIRRVNREWRAAGQARWIGDDVQLWDIYVGDVKISTERASLAWAVAVETTGVKILSTPNQ